MSKETKAQREQRYARYEIALGDAHIAARKAQIGMHEGRGLDCGFAWCVAYDPTFQAWCRKRARENGSKAAPPSVHYYGSKHYATGWCFWNPGNYPGQSIGVKEAGARAFRDALVHALQIRVEMGSRLD